MIKLIINVITGKLRARKIGRRYGLSSQVISELYLEFYIFSQTNGLVPSMRGFEITLRKNLAEKIPDTKMIEPLYCKGLDPLNPYVSSDVNEGKNKMFSGAIINGLYKIQENRLKKRAKRALKKFISILQKQNDELMGTIAAYIYDFRNKLLDNDDLDLLFLDECIEKRPNLVIFLEKIIREALKNNRSEDSLIFTSAVWVWAHSVTVASFGYCSEHVNLAKEMWKELQRGFPFIEQAIMYISLDSGCFLDMRGARCIPEKLNPDIDEGELKNEHRVNTP